MNKLSNTPGWLQALGLLTSGMAQHYSNIIGIDDGPFTRGSRESVLVVGPVFAGHRLDGLLTTQIEQDGLDSTERLVSMLRGSKFASHIQLIMIGGVTLGGFNVVDLHRLANETEKPVMAVTRKRPNLDAIKRALENVPNSQGRWQLIERLGAMEAMDGLFIQRVGVDADVARATLTRSVMHGNYPEPLRVAHLLAGGFAMGESSGAA